MALVWGDRVLETSTSTGTGAFTLTAAITGYQRFSAVCSLSDTIYYAIYAVDANGNPSGDWETGVGTYSSANTLSRTSVQESTNAGATVDFAAGTKYVLACPTAAFVDGLSSASALDDLTDVDAASPSDGDVLTFDSGTGNWIASAPTSGGGSGTDMFNAGKTYRAAYGKFNSSSHSDLGINLTATGSNVLTNFSATSFLTSLSRSSRTTGGTAEAYAGWRDADLAVILRNGFKVSILFGVSTIAGADTRVFAGVVSDSLLNTDEDPVNFDYPLGFGLDAADSNWQRFNGSGTTGATKDDTGIALTAGDVIEVIIECAAGGSDVTMTLHQWTGTSAAIANTYGPVTVSTSIPPNNQALYPYLWINNNGTAGASIIDLIAMKAWI